ncbi:MAG: hypothetical protein WB424_15860, partial [Terracidiphilus sp.]
SYRGNDRFISGGDNSAMPLQLSRKATQGDYLTVCVMAGVGYISLYLLDIFTGLFFILFF